MATKLVKTREEEEEENLRKENNRRTDEALKKVSAQRAKSSERGADEEKRKRALESIHRMEWLKNQYDIAASMQPGTGRKVKERGRKERGETIKNLLDLSTTAEVPPPPPRNAPPAPPAISAWAVKPGAALFRGTSAELRVTYNIKNYDEELMLGQALQESLMDQGLGTGRSHPDFERPKYEEQRNSQVNSQTAGRGSRLNQHGNENKECPPGKACNGSTPSGYESDENDYYEKGRRMAAARAKEREESHAKERNESRPREREECQAKEREESRAREREESRAREREESRAREREESRAREREESRARKREESRAREREESLAREREESRAREREESRARERARQAAAKDKYQEEEEPMKRAIRPVVESNMMSFKPRSSLRTPRSSPDSLQVDSKEPPQTPTEKRHVQFAVETRPPGPETVSLPRPPEDQRKMWASIPQGRPSTPNYPEAPPKFTEVASAQPEVTAYTGTANSEAPVSVMYNLARTPKDTVTGTVDQFVHGVNNLEEELPVTDRGYTPEAFICFERSEDTPANPMDSLASNAAATPFQNVLYPYADYRMNTGIPVANPQQYYSPGAAGQYYPGNLSQELAGGTGPLHQAFQGLQLGGVPLDPRLLEMTLHLSRYFECLGGITPESFSAVASQLPKVPLTSTERPRTPPPPVRAQRSGIVPGFPQPPPNVSIPLWATDVYNPSQGYPGLATTPAPPRGRGRHS